MTKLIFNSLTLVFTLFLNYWLNSGVVDGKTVGLVSDQYDTLFVPAGYAFGIWLLIYLGLIAFLGYQWYSWLNGNREPVQKTGPWFALSNVFNGLWMYAWLNEYIGLSVLLMIGILIALIMLVRRLNMEIWDAPRKIIFFQWWPIAWYLGWIIIASVANVAAWFLSLGWEGGPLSETSWTLAMIVIASLIYIYLLRSRNLRESVAIGVWGLVALAVRHWGENEIIAWTALAVAVILFAMISLHGYRNRRALPF